MNYFKILCFVWAFIGIGSRIIMGMMGESWKEWELDSAYATKRPKTITFIGILGYLLVIFTWYMVITTTVSNSWIIAALVSLTVIKISTILFKYDVFRAFAVKTLNDKKKMMSLNVGVLIYSALLVGMGIFLY